ncbi:MAG: AAA family ATPase [Rickettsiales bacterium]|nr:AAA family ATPase [Rickettsiales bacterium]
MREVTRVKYQQFKLPDYLFFASVKARKQKTGTERFDPSLAASGREAFTSSTSPAKAINKKTIILDSNGCIDLSFTDRIAFAKKLIQIGFEVYLCSKSEPFGFIKLSEDLANYQILDKLTKFNYKLDYQELANSFQLARDKVKVLNPVDLYEVRTSFTELFKNSNDPFVAHDDLKLYLFDKPKSYEDDIEQLISEIFKTEDETLKEASSFVEKIDVLTNLCIEKTDGQKILLRKLTLYSDIKSYQEKKSQILKSLIDKKEKFFESIWSSFSQGETDFTIIQGERIFLRLYESNKKYLKLCFDYLFANDKFNTNLLISALSESEVRTIFFEQLIKFYPVPNYSFLSKFDQITFGTLLNLKTINYEYAKNVFRILKNDDLISYLREFPEDHDYLIQKLRDKYSNIRFQSEKQAVKLNDLEKISKLDIAKDCFLKFQEFIDEQYCRSFLIKKNINDNTLLCRSLIKVWPNLIDEISLKEFNPGNRNEQFKFVSTVFEVRPDLVATILKDEYWLEIEFEEWSYSKFFKSAYESNPEATKEFVKQRMERRNIRITPFIAAIFPEEAESILENLTDYNPLLIDETQAFNIFEYFIMKKCYRNTTSFENISNLFHCCSYFSDVKGNTKKDKTNKLSFSKFMSHWKKIDYISSRRPTSIFFEIMSSKLINELSGMYPKDFFNEVVTLEIFQIMSIDFEKFKELFPNLKHISIPFSLTHRVLEFERLKRLCKEPKITIEVNQLSIAKSQYYKDLDIKSDDIEEIKSRQNLPKPGEIFLGRSNNDFKLDSSNEKQSFQMYLSGKVLNNDFRGNPQIIYSVATVTISGSVDFEVVSANEFQTIVITNVTSEKIAEFASSQSSSKLYASLNISLKKGERKFLSCLSSFDEFEGVIGNIPKGVRILKGDDGFYYSESDRDIDFSYIVSSDQTRKAVLSNLTAKEIINEFKDKPDDYKEIIAEIPNNTEDVKLWLDNLYDQKLGACRHRVAAVYHKLLEAGISKDNIRAYGINGSHVIIALKEGENWISYDLGGRESNTIYKIEQRDKKIEAEQRDKKIEAEQKDEKIEAEQRDKKIEAEQRDEKIEAEQRDEKIEAEQRDENIKIDLKNPSYIYNKNYNFLTIKKDNHASEKSDNSVVQKSNPIGLNNDLEELRQFLLANTSKAIPQRERQTQKQDLKQKLLQDFQTKFSFQTLEQDVFENLLTNAASKILIATDRIDEHANYLIRQYKDRLFYIDNPDQLDFTRSRLKIADNSSVSLTEESDLEFFLRSPEHGNGALVINWSAFSNQQKVALNTLLDREATLAGHKLSQDLKIISLDNARSEDPSFASRHNVSYKSLLSPQVRDHDKYEGLPEHKALAFKASQAETTQIDLMGLSDWRLALFGKILLEGESMVWHHSSFVDAVRTNASNFEISNLSEEAAKELNYEVKQAKAKGFFAYHGHRIKLPDDFDVKVTSKNFDFSKFNAISVRKNCKYEQAEGTVIINTHIFDQLLHKHQIKDGQYQEIPGLLEVNNSGSLSLFVTSELTEAQYYCMLNEAKRFNVKLKLLLAPYISLPSKIKTDNQVLLKASDGRGSELSGKSKIIVTNDLSSYGVQRDEQFIDIEDFGFEALISSITYKASQEGFSEFDQHISKFIEGLQKGEKFVLRGEFTDAMLNILAPFIAESGENLTIVVEDMDLSAKVIRYPRLDWLSDRLEFRYKELETKQEVIKRIEVEDKSFELADSEAKAKRFIETRKELVLDALAASNMLLLEGHSGVGKSSLMKEFEEHDHDKISVHRELNSFVQWAEDKSEGKTKILFIDESNIEDKHFTLFNGLKSVGAKSIFYNGKFYNLTENHKVVFACNPIEYGGGRFEQKLFNKGDIPIIEFRDFPASYIYEKILKRPIYCQRMSIRLDESRFKEICRPLIEEYKKYQELSGDTVRELQEQVLGELLIAFKVELAGDLKGSNFITTSATKAVEKELYDAINIRVKQRSGVFNGVASGLNGVLLEGGAGVGKSEMIKEMLKANNIRPKGYLGGHCYYKIEADMPLLEKRALIIKAFEEGNIVWIDEINSCLDDGLEKLLNSVLIGIHPDTGERSAKAGFMLLASCNSAGLEGRSIISPALRHRMSMPKLQELVDYKIEDFEQIIKHWYRHDEIDEVKALQLGRAFKEMISNPEYTEYNLRMFRDVLISEYGLTGKIHYQERVGEAGDLYSKTSIYEVSGDNLGDGFVGKIRAEHRTKDTINDKIAQSLKEALADTSTIGLLQKQINPEEFMNVVIEFAHANNGVGNAPKKAVDDFCREYGADIYELAKSFSASYQKYAQVNGLYTGREDGDNDALLRKDKEVGARLKRIPKELVEDLIKKALDIENISRL